MATVMVKKKRGWVKMKKRAMGSGPYAGDLHCTSDAGKKSVREDRWNGTEFRGT